MWCWPNFCVWSTVRYLALRCQHVREVAMRKQMTRQTDLFEDTVRETLVPEEIQPDLVRQLALLMHALIGVIETEVHDEQDRR
jgi:hypothetical protein